MSDAPADLDPVRYVSPAVPDVPGGLALGRALLAAADPTLSAAVQRATQALRTAVMVLEQRWTDAQWTDEPEDPSDSSTDARSADLRLDRAWVAVGRRLEVLADLPPRLPEARAAAAFHRALFPDGLVFLSLPFRQQWTESERRVRWIEQESLRPSLAPLVGGFVLDELMAAHRAYGEALGIHDPTAGLGAPVRLTLGLRELRDAIAGYGLQLVALAYDEPALAPAVRAALRPIDAQAYRGTEEELERDPERDPDSDSDSDPDSDPDGSRN